MQCICSFSIHLICCKEAASNEIVMLSVLIQLALGRKKNIDLDAFLCPSSKHPIENK